MKIAAFRHDLGVVLGGDKLFQRRLVFCKADE
jgi:hypothetical protein